MVIGSLLPDLLKASVIEYALAILSLLILQDIADCSSEPLRIQNNDILQALVISVVDNLTQIVQQFGQGLNLLPSNTIALAGLIEHFVRNLRIRLSLGEDFIPHGSPT